jgi:ATP synthase protein I
MTPNDKNLGEHPDRAWVEHVNGKVARKVRAGHRSHRNVLHGLGLVGTIGWSVTVPPVGGAMLGSWLDEHYPSQRSWTLTLLILGLFIGCFIAYRWVLKEHKDIHREHRHDNK